MSLKFHFLHSHLDFFPENMENISDEHGERFHQDIFQTEQRYSGKWSPDMLADPLLQSYKGDTNWRK